MPMPMPTVSSVVSSARTMIKTASTSASASASASDSMYVGIAVFMGVMLVVQVVWLMRTRRILREAQAVSAEMRTTGEHKDRPVKLGLNQTLRAFEVVWDVDAGYRGLAERGRRISLGTFEMPLHDTSGARALHASIRGGLVNSLLLDGMAVSVVGSIITPDTVLLTARLLGRRHVFGGDVFAPDGEVPVRYVSYGHMLRDPSAYSDANTRPKASVLAVVFGFTV